MPRIARSLALTLLLTDPGPLVAQRAPGSVTQPRRANQLSLDVGYLEGGITYARRLGRGPFSLGGGLWAAWEPWNTFEQNVWNVRGVELFLRLQHRKTVQLELGPSVLGYNYEDDCSDCVGTFVGLRAAIMVGEVAFRLGPIARLGWADSPQGSEAGALLGVQGRQLLSWGGS